MATRDSGIDEIKSRVNIVDIIGREVSLKRAGSNYTGLCPFHHEKTPSFVVSESKQIFTCFGCNASGDVIEFVKRFYGLDFVQASEKLAAECGVVLQKKFGSTEKDTALYELNRDAAVFFYKTMRTTDNPAMKYMLGRGMSQEIMKTFGIGYADSNWDTLHQYLLGKGYTDEQMLEVGLIAKTPKGKIYDYFRDRVIFPIQDVRGRVIGFGGRRLDESVSPKYLNSKESSIFYKKNNLYGLNNTQHEIGKEDHAIMVEGYMDVVSLYQAGVKNVSASLGTALTENQAKLLKRYSKNIVLSYDSDEAGIKAALRGSEILHAAGCNVKVMHVTDGKDPDEYIKQKGKTAFMDLVKGALPYADYHIEAARKQYGDRTLEGKSKFLAAVAEILNKLEPVTADLYISKIATQYGISEDSLKAQMKGITTEKPQYAKRQTQEQPAEFTNAERDVIKIILRDERYFAKDENLNLVFTSLPGIEVFKTMETVYKSNGTVDAKELMKMLPDELCGAFALLADEAIVGDIARIFKDCIENAKLKYLKDEEARLIDQIAIAEDTQSSEVLNELIKKLVKVQQKIKLGGR